jgi:ferric-dicitrate binding protein FerR (iron transport regulator)
VGAVLVAGMRGVIDDSGNVRVLPNGLPDEYTDLTSGQLVFHKTSVRDVVAELGRVYGADIRLDDSTLAAKSLTWTVPFTKKSLAGALEFLTIVLEAHVTQSGNVITILPGAASSHKTLGPLTPYRLESQNGR